MIGNSHIFIVWKVWRRKMIMKKFEDLEMVVADIGISLAVLFSENYKLAVIDIILEKM